MSTVKSILIFIIGMAIGASILYWFYMSVLPKHHNTTNSETLLKNIQNVCKMVTVEGDFTNLIDHKDFIGIDWPILRKKAILKVNAKVSAGYDLEQLQFSLSEKERTMRIKNFPKASIISVEPDIKYYDLQQGFFNSFSEEELTELNKMAKDIITLKAYNSELMQQAENQGLEILNMIRLMAETAGWSVIYEQEYEMNHLD